MKDFIFTFAGVIVYLLLTEPGFKERIVFTFNLIKLKLQTTFKKSND
jgi:hypothetical protein